MKETWFRRNPNGRYSPVAEAEKYDYMVMPGEGFTLTYRKDGRTQYEYKVQADTASFKAAAMVAREAMEEAAHQAAAYRPQLDRPYTKRQLALIEQFKRDMGMRYPMWWTAASAHQIVQAGIDAVGAEA